MTAGQKNSLDVILPVFNEAGSIGLVVEELYRELASRLETRIIICEDGSTDGTKDVLVTLSKIYPILLVMSAERKGYSRAVLDGMKVTEAPYVLFLDSDGQCDPKDFQGLWSLIPGHDIVIGRRVNRSDSFLRLCMSRSFKLVHDLLFHVPIHDPSCPFVLTSKSVVDGLIPDLGVLDFGFWWELTARAHSRGLNITETPVNHRNRISGATRVYNLKRMPRIAITHLAGLVRIWRETRSYKATESIQAP